MNIDEWKKLAKQYFKSNTVTDEHWAIMADCLLRASENEGLDGGLNESIEAYEAAKTEQPVQEFKPVHDEKAYALVVHLKGFEAHIAGKENAKQFRDEMRMLLDMIKSPPYLSQPVRESGEVEKCADHQ